VIAPAAASFLVPWRDLLCNASFVLLSIGSAVVPTVLFALFSPEFPLVAGETLGRGGGRGGERGRWQGKLWSGPWQQQHLSWCPEGAHCAMLALYWYHQQLPYSRSRCLLGCCLRFVA
jgi:hypothetical protein